MDKIIPFEFELHVNDAVTAQDEAQARARAADTALLGIEDDLVPAPDAPFESVLATLLMFDPAWLFARDWISGWTVEPSRCHVILGNEDEGGQHQCVKLFGHPYPHSAVRS